VLVGLGCSDPDNSALVAKDASPDQHTGGAGGAGGGGGGSKKDGGSDSADGGKDSSHDGADSKDAGQLDVQQPESGFVPDGPSVFTFFHGIPNVRNLRVCFEAQGPNGFAPLPVPPLPNTPLGMEFGTAFSLRELDGVDLETQAVRPIVYTGEIDLIGDALCDALGSFPNEVGRVALQVIPAGTLARQRSVLMVAAGCAAGSVAGWPNVAAVCGNGFDSSKGNVTLLMASMDRPTPKAYIGIQVFAASVASQPLGLDHLAASSNATVRFVSNLSLGKIAPRPPATTFAAVSLGSTPEENHLRVYVENASNPTVVQRLTDALARGGLSLDSLENGKNYTKVLAGPLPGMLATDWYRGHVVTVLPSDP